MANMIFIAVFTIIYQVSHAAPPLKIVGGNDASITDYPWVVSVRYMSAHTCGGVFITKHHILTAAHCVQHEHPITGKQKLVSKRYLSVASGSSSCQDIKNLNKVESYEVHQNYNGSWNDFHNDIAIITLVKDIVESKVQKVINLPSKPTGGNEVGYVVGWGRLHEGEEYDVSPDLQQALMKTITNRECSKLLPDNIQNGQMCARSKPGVGFCDGDSGGPIIINGAVVGIVSASDGCGTGLPDVYTRVYSYLSWIRERIQ